jgi:arylsulfatase A-like enzyme
MKTTRSFRAAIRQGDWKLIWKTLLPASVELYNLAQDPSEKSDVAAQNPDKVAALEQRANELAATMAKPLLLETEIGAMMQRLKLPPSLPAELGSLNEEH